MAFRLVQFRDLAGGRGVAAFLEDAAAVRLSGVATTYELALAAIRDGVSLVDAARARAGEAVDLTAAEAEGRLLGPIDHPDPAHCYVTGTGLTHLGSAEGRDQMHKAAAGGTLTDSMRMFNMGLEGGKPDRRQARRPARMVLQR